MLAFDTETHLIGPGEVAPAMVCLSLARGPTDYGLFAGGTFLHWNTPIPWKPTEYMEWFMSAAVVDLNGEEFLSEQFLSEDMLIGHNMPFDMGVIANHWPGLHKHIWEAYERDAVRDTGIRAQLRAIKLDHFKYDPAIRQKPSFSLDELSQIHLDRKLDKSSWRLRYKELEHIPVTAWPAGAVHYAVADAVTTLDVWEKLEEELPGGYPDEWLQNRAAWGLHLASAWGLETDQEAVAKLTEELKVVVERNDNRLKELGLMRENGVRNMQAIKDAVEEAFALLGEDPPLTKTGGISTDEDARERVKGLSEKVDAYHASLGNKKILNEFIPTLKPLVNPRFYPLVRSGRTSCRNPNLQQPPTKGGVRECFVPREGHVYIQADISRAEMCAIAQICYIRFGFSELGEMLKRGIDPHTMVAARLCHVSYETARVILTNPEHSRYIELVGARQLGKIANFGLWGGMGAEAFVGHCRRNGVIITLSESWDLKNLEKELFPEMQLFFDDVGAAGRNHSRTQLFSGRVRGGLNFTNGCNTQFQGLVGEAAKEATYELQFCHYNQIPQWKPLYRNRLVNFVHDEWVAECLREKAEEALPAMEKLLVSVVQKWMPNVPIEIEGKIMERWTK